jgi:hypothetical protein
MTWDCEVISNCENEHEVSWGESVHETSVHAQLVVTGSGCENCIWGHRHCYDLHPHCLPLLVPFPCVLGVDVAVQKYQKCHQKQELCFAP